MIRRFTLSSKITNYEYTTHAIIFWLRSVVFIALGVHHMPRYIAVFNLPNPTYEHAKIDNVISDASGNNFKKVVLGKSTVIYLFDSSKKPHHYSFSLILLDGDEVAFFEVNDYFHASGFRALQGWLNSHPNK